MRSLLAPEPRGPAPVKGGTLLGCKQKLSREPAITWVADPDPHNFGKPDLDSHNEIVQTGSGSASESKFGIFRGFRGRGRLQWTSGDSKWSRRGSVDQ